jgi:hypothetical protein
VGAQISAIQAAVKRFGNDTPPVDLDELPDLDPDAASVIRC